MSALRKGAGRIGAVVILVPDNKCANNNNMHTSASIVALISGNSKHINY